MAGALKAVALAGRFWGHGCPKFFHEVMTHLSSVGSALHVVVGIGLLEDNVAVVRGAMVIAPLLGPNIALALGSALGDGARIWRASKIFLSGLGCAILLGAGIGLFWPYGLDSVELLARTNVGLDSVTLALASGLAAVISLTTSVPSVLVGVMVAVVYHFSAE